MPLRLGENTNKYFLHYVGSRLYSQSQFTEEAERIGVNRAFPPQIAKGFKWHQPILLAYHTSVILNGQVGKVGQATVFGYYTIDGINYDCQNKEEFIQKLIQKLDVRRVSEGSGTVRRRCGSYTIGISYAVTNPISEIMEKAEEIAKELNMTVKTFLAGTFHKLAPKAISPIAFSRAGLTIELDEQIESTEQKDKILGFLGNYKSRKYLKKDEEP